ncbi:hypothetical protein PT103_00565 [Erysipelothrix rhusiopathiae]|nr:hypothetical protein [Erysipelothrix rhusiopathiae]MDE8165437.1 hypothetical protein [Erysipelothrix rhusiopathiae]
MKENEFIDYQINQLLGLEKVFFENVISYKYTMEESFQEAELDIYQSVFEENEEGVIHINMADFNNCKSIKMNLKKEWEYVSYYIEIQYSSMIITLYQVWEKKIIEYFKKNKKEKVQNNKKSIFAAIEKYFPSYDTDKIDEIRLVCNVLKHGPGVSWNQLKQRNNKWDNNGKFNSQKINNIYLKGCFQEFVSFWRYLQEK